MGRSKPTAGAITRRSFFATITASAATMVVLTAGQSFGWLDGVNLFAPRKQRFGPQDVPVNRTAAKAGVLTLARDPSWVLTVVNGSTTRSYSRAQLLALPQTDAQLPITCVEGWSTDAHWRGVRVADLMADVGRPADRDVRVQSLQPHGNYRSTVMGAEYVQDPNTLVALELNGAPLDIDHGYPARIIAPGRPGVLQTKWLSRIETI